VTMSVGVASGPPGEMSGDDLVMAADVAVYRAKRLGRNRVVAAGTEDANDGQTDA
jgi:PleD family two-component response regulator